MKKIILLNKKEGETPLQALERFRQKNKKYKDIKMTYAGRLDPLASGVLLLLAGEEVREKEKYLKLGKEYTFEILFGFATDTYDILGKITHSNMGADVGTKELEKKIKKNLKHFTGKFVQKYPIYSSRTVNGKALFRYAREGIEVEAPTIEVSVKELKFWKLRKISGKKLLQNIAKRIKKVEGPARNTKSIAFAGGDFRQKEILKLWRKNLSHLRHGVDIASFKIKCSSGTYVRGIANSLGDKIGTPALAYTIKRTKIGKWSASGVK